MLQMQSKTTHQDNIKTLETAAQKAKDADLLVLPEYSGLLDKNVAEVQKSITTKTKDPFIKACCIWLRFIIFGSILGQHQ